jgi:hypothetical protein
VLLKGAQCAVRSACDILACGTAGTALARGTHTHVVVRVARHTPQPSTQQAAAPAATMSRSRRQEGGGGGGGGGGGREGEGEGGRKKEEGGDRGPDLGTSKPEPWHFLASRHLVPRSRSWPASKTNAHVRMRPRSSSRLSGLASQKSGAVQHLLSTSIICKRSIRNSQLNHKRPKHWTTLSSQKCQVYAIPTICVCCSDCEKSVGFRI